MASRRRALILVLALAASLVPIAAAPVGAATSVFINEIHYDNAGGDIGEAVEIAGVAGTDLSAYSLVLYNGNGGAPYNTVALSGSIPDEAASGFGAVEVAIAGLQNGSPDGIALVMGSSVIQFLSYEGSFAAVGGPADTMMSTDIGVSESSATAVGDSLQLGGTGTVYEDFSWQAEQANTFGSTNTGQTWGAAPPPPPPSTGSDTLVINEIDYDQPSTDTAEFVEIFNVSSEAISLEGWSLQFVNGNGGSVYQNFPLPSTSLAAGGYFVLCGDAATTDNCDLDVSPNSNLIQNGAPDAVALFNGDTLVDTVSYEGDTVAPYTEGSGAGLEDSSSAGFVGISRTPNGADTDVNNVDLSLRCITPGEENTTDNTDCVPPAEVFIHQIQGTGGDSPLVGHRVIIEGVVVADEETFDSLAGFFVQEEDVDVDADPLTSEGVFVFNHAADDVEIGDVVRVEGTVGERFGNTQLTNFVEIEFLTEEEIATKDRTVTPTAVSFPLASIGYYEAVEGMVVEFTDALVVSEYFNYDRFGLVVMGKASPGFDRQMNPTAVYPPGSADGIALAELNRLSRVTIDDGSDDQNPERNVHPIFRDEFTLENAFRGGDTVTGLTGAMYFTRNEHRLHPLPYANGGYDTFTQSDRPDVPGVGGSLKVATLNALNYFLTIDDGSNNCGPTQSENCRGADTQEEFERQRSKLIAALKAMDADVIGLVELENTPGVEPLADLVDGLNEGLKKPVYDYIDVGVAGPDVIKVGIIYNRRTVTPIGKAAVLDTVEFLDPNDTGDDRNRAAVAATFKEQNGHERFSVVVNHFKSKGSGCGAGDDDPYAGSCNLTRKLAAEELLEWISTSPTSQRDTDWLILGDLNSYDKEDPIVALEAGGFTDLVGSFGGEGAYSYVFDGQWGHLDYALSSSSMTAQVTGAAVWNINADEPDIFDYDMSFKSDSQKALFEYDTAYRSSDHDAVIVGLDLESHDAPGWPPRHSGPRWQ